MFMTGSLVQGCQGLGTVVQPFGRGIRCETLELWGPWAWASCLPSPSPLTTGLARGRGSPLPRPGLLASKTGAKQISSQSSRRVFQLIHSLSWAGSGSVTASFGASPPHLLPSGPGTQPPNTGIAITYLVARERPASGLLAQGHHHDQHFTQDPS